MIKEVITVRSKKEWTINEREPLNLFSIFDVLKEVHNKVLSITMLRMEGFTLRVILYWCSNL